MLYQQIQQNKRKTIYLMCLFTILVLAIGWAIGYLVSGDMYSGAIITAVILCIYIPYTYASANKQVLRMAGAKEADPTRYAELYAIVEELTIPARLPMPKIYIVNDPAPNAFATGIKPNKACVGVTSGLLRTLNREELEGVIAHELAHIRNYDTRLMTISISLVSIIALIAEIGSRFMFVGGNRNNNDKRHPALVIIALLLVILGPLAAQFIRFAVSRNREYLADATAVEFTRNPQGLINALQKISGNDKKLKNAKEVTAGMYIINPFKSKSKSKKKKVNAFSTHPLTEDRIKRLSAM